MYNFVKIIAKNELENAISKEKVYLFPMEGLHISYNENKIGQTYDVSIGINKSTIISASYSNTTNYEKLIGFKVQFDRLLDKISEAELEKEVMQLVIKLIKEKDGTINLTFWNYHYNNG